jgi:cytochrome c
MVFAMMQGNYQGTTIQVAVRRFLIIGLLALLSAPTLADCDMVRGKSLYNKCAICHTNAEDAGTLVGPNLYRIIGKKVAASEDFVYTDEMVAYGINWTAELLDQFLESPLTEVRGTTMAFAGLRKEADRENLICFLSETAE